MNIFKDTSVVVLVPGSRGPTGPPGVSTLANPELVLQTANGLSEFNTDEKKMQARQNLGLQLIDCGEFF